MSIRVVLADDQEMVRAGFRLILEATDDISVVGEAADGRTAVELCRRLRPDVALLDIRMPVLDGLEATRLLAGREVAEPVRVVVVTTFDLDEYVHAALLHGATGFLLKDAGPALLVEAVRAAVRGDALVSPQVTTRLLRQLSGGAAARRAVAAPAEPLTEREGQVLTLVARGLTNAEIGGSLFVSPSTVKSHLASLQAKIGARNRGELAAWAWQSGHMDGA
ncbi:response regulator transcription factor [Iamia sp. SCSIO 61187]|uniref:response regulator n=1 Tax=Iamia sp. SCSIO 61187 TaxID=2722752 RepID=UPI001C63A1AE|nr:response regulator transcription factor [Iamia sp. SCSIO 61187]QYG94878.1 response regulator transcription factor [Iamia sp. SCSIO 61187]